MKKLIVLFLAASMTASLAACGGNNAESGTAANTEPSIESEISSEMPATEETVSESLSETESTAETGTDSAEAISSPEADLLSTIYNALAEDQKFPISGGDSENLVMDAPGALSLSKADEWADLTGLPADEADSIDGAASMIHMMNANTFTGAAYHLTKGTDADAFAEAVKQTVLAKQWICGMPDTLLILSSDDYVITAFGASELIENFKTAALSAVSGSEVILETPVTE